MTIKELKQKIQNLPDELLITTMSYSYEESGKNIFEPVNDIEIGKFIIGDKHKGTEEHVNCARIVIK